MTTSDILTQATAIWGAVTGTAALLLQLFQHLADRARLRVNATMAIVTDRTSSRPRLQVSIHVHNAGRRKVSIVRAGVILPDDDAALPGGMRATRCEWSMFDYETAGKPLELDEGQTHSFQSRAFPPELAKRLREREEAFVVEASGKECRATFVAVTDIVPQQTSAKLAAPG